MIDRRKLLAVANLMAMRYSTATSDWLKPTDLALVFAREDPRLALTTVTLYRRQLIQCAVVSGGIGKDAGKKSIEAGSEAQHQKNLMVQLGMADQLIHTETTAKNGAQNTQLGIKMIRDLGLPHDKMTLVVHPRNAYRIFAVHTLEARKLGFEAEYQVVCMDDDFNPDNQTHVSEVLGEYVKLDDWIKKDWCDRPIDFYDDLATWAREELAAMAK